MSPRAASGATVVRADANGAPAETANRDGSASQVSDADASKSLTPTLRERLRSRKVWLWVIPLLLLIGIGTPLLNGVLKQQSDVTLDPESYTPTGAAAVVNTLQSHGVTVHIARNTEQIEQAVAQSDPANTTLVVGYMAQHMTTERSEWLLEQKFPRIVALSRLNSFDPDGLIERTGYTTPPDDGTNHTLDASGRCDETMADRAPAITWVSSPTVRLAPDARGWECYGEPSGHGLAVAELDGGTELAFLAASETIQNRLLPLDGNAAMAMNLFGSEPTLIWFVPEYEPTPGETDPSMFIPPWLTPAVLLVMAGIIAAGFASGRRFGPLVSERLPVVVPMSETLEGRARLYAKSDSRLRAIDNLRVGTLSRCAATLGMNRRTPAHEIADAVARAIGMNPARVRHLLVDSAPQSDADLVSMSDELLQIERQLTGTLPTGRSAPADASAPSTTATQTGARHDR